MISAKCLDVAHGGGWRVAWPMIQLALAGVETQTPPTPAVPVADDTLPLLQSILLDWIQVAQIVLCDSADGRLYRTVCARAEQAVAQARAAQQWRFVGEMLHYQGTLHLDPYTAAYSSIGYEQQLRGWQQRFIDEAGPNVTSQPEEQWKMPAVAEALSLAANFLREAVTLRSGRLKGLSLKALVDALAWQHVVGLPVDQDEIIRAAQQALPLLADAGDLQYRLTLLARLGNLGQPVPLDEIDKVFALSLDEYSRRFGTQQTLDIVSQTANILLHQDPRRSLQLLHDARFLYAREGYENQRVNAWRSITSIFALQLVPGIPHVLPEGGIEALRMTLMTRSPGELRDAQKEAEILIALAARSGDWNEEPKGLAMLEEARGLAPLFTQEYSEALDWLRAIGTLGIGVNKFELKDYAGAIDRYGSALEDFLAKGLRQPISDILSRIDDLTQEAGPEGVVQILAHIAHRALPLETLLGKVGTQWLQQICRRAATSLLSGPFHSSDMLFLWQIAKGLRFAAMLSRGVIQRGAQNEKEAQLLQMIANAQTQGQAEVGPQQAGALGDSRILLTAYLQPEEKQSGNTHEERLANLQRAYMALLDQRLIENTNGADIIQVTLEDVQAALGARTVLLDYYLGSAPNGNMAIYVLAITREQVQATVITHPFPSSQIFMADDEQRIQMIPFANITQTVLAGLDEYPGPFPVTPEVKNILNIYQRGFLGPFVEYLAGLRQAGKDHLCIVPHGPLHYFPFHLLGDAGQPLAATWIITYLPNLNLLLSRRGQPMFRHHREHEVSAVGLSLKDNPFGLDPLPQSLDEVQSIAGLFDEQPLMEEQATTEAVLGVLQNARRVHLSTHGVHNLNAPAFQCLYLAPDEHSDGRLYAHDVLRYDLRGLDLLTLSACETAQGRFDSADNLSGLPASFLLSGVSTLIGTLWNVEANASACFFVALYAALKAGESKINAFATAQRQTRQAFPRYQDWGPFYMMGDWE